MSAPRVRVAAAGLAVAGVLAVAAPGRALAHKPSDSYLTLELAHGSGRWDIAVRDLDDALALDADGDGAVSWRDLRLREPDVADYAIGHLELDTPAGRCRLATRPLGLVEHSDGVYVSLPLAIDCPAPAASVTVDYRLLFDIDPQHQGLVRLAGGAGAPAATSPAPLWLFTARDHRRRIATGAPAATAPSSFVAQGVRHIWGGLDHILFLVALLVPAVLSRRRLDAELVRPERAWQPVAAIRPALWDVAQVVTSFTAAHSLTLSLAALDLARMPARITEPAIAASVVLAAVNNLRPLFGRDRWVVAFALGLLHGFGFSSVLTDTGLGGLALLPALAGFNLGVEIGQLAIVAALVPLCFALRRTVFYRRFALPAGSLTIAAVALVWFFERALDTPLFPRS